MALGRPSRTNILQAQITAFHFYEDAAEYCRDKLEQVKGEVRNGAIGPSMFSAFLEDAKDFIYEARQLLPTRNMGRGARRLMTSSTLPWGMHSPVPTHPPRYLPIPSSPLKLPTEQTFGEIEAFRVWRVFDHQPTLYSSYIFNEWKPGEDLQSHKLPADNDDSHSNISYERTGIHAWKSMVEVVDHGMDILANQDADAQMRGWKHRAIAFGRIKLWGEVVEHERGYRAEFGKIVGVDDLVEVDCKSMDYEIQMDRVRFKSRQLTEDLEALRDRYFPDRKKRIK